LLCTYLSAVLVVNSLFGWSWADPVVALVIAAVAVKEGREAWRGTRAAPCLSALPALSVPLSSLRGIRAGAVTPAARRPGRRTRPTAARRDGLALHHDLPDRRGDGVRVAGLIASPLHRRHRAPAQSPGCPAQPSIFLALALLLGVAALLLAATTVVLPVSWLTHPAVQVAGLVIALAGFADVVAAQHAMGRSWRVGVGRAERTEVVTGGVFGRARTSVFTAMITASVGLTSMVPSVPQLLALVCLVAGVELQVRVVEEPYLSRTHGIAYDDYARTVGWFLPGVGRRQPTASQSELAMGFGAAKLMVRFHDSV
jgi:protein-S-isoprenylcysteine O-methyltransferase Ste14